MIFSQKNRVLKLCITSLFISSSLMANISGTVFRDFNLNGVQDTLEPAIIGITVSAYDDSGMVNSQVTDANGNYILLTSAGKYRLEVSTLPSYLKPATAISGNTASLVSVVENGATHNIGLHNEGQYCQANPNLILTRFTKEDINGPQANTNTLIQFPYTSNGTDAPTDIATHAKLGSVYGVAHVRKANVTYASSYFKRLSGVGPSGIGTIYKIDHVNGNAVNTFSTLPGTNPRNTGLGYDWLHDTVGYVYAGKKGIGDIEISDDEAKLFAVNMEDRKLYVINVNNDGSAGTTSSYNIPNPCNDVIDFRPMGLGFNDGMLYVGVTCTAESTVDADNVDDSYSGPRMGDSTKLSAHIYSFSPNNLTFSAVPVVNIPLDYGRGCIYNADIANTMLNGTCYQVPEAGGGTHPFVADWKPWQMDYDIVFNDKAPGNVQGSDIWVEYPQPLLSDIEFDDDGSMIISIRDINGDRGGYESHSPNPVDNDKHNNNGMGDLLRACGNAQIGWVLENNGTCGNVTTGGAGNLEGLGGGEFYWYDSGPGGNGGYNNNLAGHADVISGGILHVSGHPDIITGAIDVHTTMDTGLLWLRNDTGQISTDANGDNKRLLVSNTDPVMFFGKAGGMGDVEALCDPAPIEIGNYVWEDLNKDGIQDPNEPAIAGAVVNLYEAGTLVGTASTDTNGYYYFGGLNNTNMTGSSPLKTNTPYELKIALNDVALNGKVPTVQDVNSNAQDQRDSDGDNGTLDPLSSTIAYTTGSAGQNDHKLDFGFKTLEPSIDIEKATNTIDADSPSQAVSVGTGDVITWSYVVTNNGNETLVNIAADDDKEGAIVCPKTSLAPDENMTCTSKTGEAGTVDYENNASVIAQGQTSGTDVRDSDLSHYTVSFGSWSGNVSKDTNNDDVGDEMLQGVEVKLYSDPNGDGDYSDGTLISSTVTDANGNYSFTGLPAGDYVAVETQPSGLADVTENEGGADNDQKGSTPVNTISGHVDAGEDDSNNDFVEEEPTTIPVTPTGTYHIGTHFWIDSNADGLFDTAETPIAGALVELFDSTGNKIGETTTDNGGEYGFDVPAGTYQVKFHIPNTAEYKGFVFSKANSNTDNNLNINQANTQGLTQSVTVGPNAKTQDLTLDAGINCGCANVSSDSSAAQSTWSLLAMMLLTLMTALYFVRKEE